MKNQWLMKSAARLLLFAFYLQLMPAPAYGQQTPAPKPGTRTDPAAPGLVLPERTPLPVPELDLFLWKSYRENPLIGPDCLPQGYGQDEAQDKLDFQDLVEGVMGRRTITPAKLKECDDRFWAGASLVFFRSEKPVPSWFKDEFKSKVRSGKFVTQEFREGFLFWPCGMAWTPKGSNLPRFTGNPQVMFKDQLFVWMVDAIYMREGPYMGHWLAPVVPTGCVNLTCMAAVETTESYPTEPVVPPVFRSIKVENEWQKVTGRRADAPSREEIQARIEVVPQDGGETIKVEMLDNRKVELNLIEGKSYTIREYLETEKWRLLTDTRTITVGEKNETVRFIKMEVPQLTQAVPVSPPPLQPPTIIREVHECKDCGGLPKWVLPLIAGAAGIGVVGWYLGRSNTVVVDARKGGGPSNPGGRPQ